MVVTMNDKIKMSIHLKQQQSKNRKKKKLPRKQKEKCQSHLASQTNPTTTAYKLA